MYSENDRFGFKKLIVVLAILAGVILCFDIWEVATHRVDLNKHLPFFLPVVLAIFAGIVWRIELHYRSLSPEAQERLKKKVEEDSFLNPKNRHGDYS